MKTLSAFLMCLVVLVVAASVARLLKTSRGATKSIYGNAITSRSPAYVEYFEKASAAFDQHLKESGFSVTIDHPRQLLSGRTYAAQRDTWYRGSYRGSPQLYVKIVLATDNMAGLDVDLSWYAEGLPVHVASVEASANDLCIELRAWWAQYERDNPLPGNWH
jgi:hypothetical protein